MYIARLQQKQYKLHAQHTQLTTPSSMIQKKSGRKEKACGCHKRGEQIGDSQLTKEIGG
jgi:hypothetical protein